MKVWYPLVLTGLTLAQGAMPSVVNANGDLFFEAQEIPGKAAYVVFGTVKDDQGHYLEGVDVTIHVGEPFLTYTEQTNFLGHYRTLDVGRAVEGLGYQIDPTQIQVEVAYPGYHEVRRLYRGKRRQKSGGAIELNLVMAPDSTPAGAN